MKLTTVLMFMCCLHISARSVSQTVTLRVKNVPLTKVFNEIKKQTGYTFIYTESLLKESKRVSLTFNRDPLENVLTKCFSGQPFSYRIINKTVVIEVKSVEPILKLQSSDDSLKNFSQKLSKPPIEIKGRVTDENGNPLEGVSISVKGTPTVGTTTNERGEYSFVFEAKNNIILVFSYVGHTTIEIPLNGRTMVDVTLKASVSSLNDVVIVGYGTQRKENLTGAIDQINSKDIGLRPSGTINNALQGLIPGFNVKSSASGAPNSNPEFNIRGFNSINGGAPLVLIDGIEGNLQDINPNDIESVTVLKDAASAAIYGARGAFGVILVKTKSGHIGEDVKVTYTNNFGWQTPTTRTDYISNPYLFATVVNRAIGGYNGTSYTTGYTDFDMAALHMVADGKIDPFYEKQNNGTYKFFYNTDWYKYLFRDVQPTSFHNLSISGGSDKLRGFLSGRIFDQATINNLQHNDMKRYNLNSKIAFQPVKWLELSTGLRFMQSDRWDYGGARDGFGSIFGTGVRRYLFPWNPTEIDGVPVTISAGGTDGNGQVAGMVDGNSWRHYIQSQNVASFGLVLKPVKGLEINAQYNDDVTTDRITHHEVPYDVLSSNRLSPQNIGSNRIAEYRYIDHYKALNAYGTYQIDLNRKHNFKIMVGGSQESFDRDRISAEQRDNLVLDKSNLSFGTEMFGIDGSTSDWALESLFGRFNYDYLGKYLVEFDFRYDGSSRFPKGDRWGMFPSVSAGWIISKEKFYKENFKKVASTFKLRGSFGQLGNQSIPLNTFLELISVSKSSWLVDGDQQLVSGSVPAPLPSVTTWENTKTLDFGADLGFVNDQVLVSFDWYRRETDNIYLPGEPLPAVFGASEPKENYASLVNRGFELSVKYRNTFQVHGKPLNLGVTANLSNFKGKITRFNNPRGLMSTFWEGMELGQMWGYHVDGQFQSDLEAATYQSQFENPTKTMYDTYRLIMSSQVADWQKLRAGDPKYIDLNGDGELSKGDNTLDDHGDLIPIGNAMPRFPFGFNINVGYMGFDLGVTAFGIGHQDWSPQGARYWGPYNRPYQSYIRKDLVENAWTEEKPGKYPQIDRGYTALSSQRSLWEPNDYYLENVGFLRIKNLTFGYTLPKELTTKIFIQSLRIYFSGENIFVKRFGSLTKYIDPEQAGAGISYGDPNQAAGRSSVDDYPYEKTYSFGVQVTF